MAYTPARLSMRPRSMRRSKFHPHNTVFSLRLAVLGALSLAGVVLPSRMVVRFFPESAPEWLGWVMAVVVAIVPLLVWLRIGRAFTPFVAGARHRWGAAAATGGAAGAAGALLIYFAALWMGDAKLIAAPAWRLLVIYVVCSTLMARLAGWHPTE